MSEKKKYVCPLITKELEVRLKYLLENNNRKPPMIFCIPRQHGKTEMNRLLKKLAKEQEDES